MRFPNAETRALFRSFAERTCGACHLLSGASGTGKKTLAKLCVNALLCEHTDANARPCGKCPSCVRFAAGTHPDVHTLSAKHAATRSISIDAVRELIESLHENAYEGGYKAAFVFEAERLTPQAQNALLKSIEEPTATCIFIFTTENRYALLPTVRSRLATVNVTPLSVDEASLVLREMGISERDAIDAARYANGSVGDALTYINETKRLVTEVMDALAGLRGYADIQRTQKALTDIRGENAERTQAIFGAFEHAASVDAYGYKTRSNMLSHIDDARRRVALYMSWNAVIEKLLIDWLEEIIGKGCRSTVSQRNQDIFF